MVLSSLSRIAITGSAAELRPQQQAEGGRQSRNGPRTFVSKGAITHCNATAISHDRVQRRRSRQCRMKLAAQAAAASAGEVEARKQLPMKLTRLRGATHTQKRLRMKTVPSCGSKRRVERGGRCVFVRVVCVGLCVPVSVCVWRCEGESCSPVRGVGIGTGFWLDVGQYTAPCHTQLRNLRRKLRAQPEGREEQTSTAGQRDRAGNTKDFCGCDQEKRPPDEAPKAASAFWTAHKNRTESQFHHYKPYSSQLSKPFPAVFSQLGCL